MDIINLPLSQAQQALFVLDSMTELPSSESLLRVLKCQNAHIVVIDKSCNSFSKLEKEIDQKLVRGCRIINIDPLTMIHSTQRIVHSLMLEHTLMPSNKDQRLLEELAEFTSGSPLIIDIASQLLCSKFSLHSDLHQALYHFAEEISLGEHDSQSMQLEQDINSQSSQKVVEIPTISIPSAQDILRTDAKYDSWESIYYLVNSCQLSVEETFLMECISVFGSVPVPF